MFKFISLFVCLLGVSLASLSSSSEVESLLKAVKKHQQYLDVCAEDLGVELKSCSELVDDMVTLEDAATNAVSEASSLYEQGLTLFAKFGTCGTKSIFKQVACYEEVLTEAKTLISTAEQEAEEVQSELSTDVSQLESDLESCIAAGYTSQLLNSKMALCKLRLMMKN